MRHKKQVGVLSRRSVVLLMTLGIVLALAALTACAPRTNQEPSTAEETDQEVTAGVFSWAVDSDCSRCHAKEAQPSDASGTVAFVHTNSGMACQSCHIDAAGLESAHKNVALDSTEGVLALKMTEVKPGLCLDCHNADELADKTQESTILTDLNGTVVNPHALPSVPEHETLTCLNCHAMHRSSSIERTATRACASCHHANVYECNTCHT